MAAKNCHVKACANCNDENQPKKRLIEYKHNGLRQKRQISYILRKIYILAQAQAR